MAQFCNDRAKRKHVTCVRWNPEYPDLFAVGYGSYDFLKQVRASSAVLSMRHEGGGWPPSPPLQCARRVETIPQCARRVERASSYAAAGGLTTRSGATCSRRSHGAHAYEALVRRDEWLRWVIIACDACPSVPRSASARAAQVGGMFCLYSLKNPSYPDLTCTTEAGVMCLDWHPQARNSQYVYKGG